MNAAKNRPDHPILSGLDSAFDRELLNIRRRLENVAATSLGSLAHSANAIRKIVRTAVILMNPI